MTLGDLHCKLGRDSHFSRRNLRIHSASRMWRWSHVESVSLHGPVPPEPACLAAERAGRQAMVVLGRNLSKSKHGERATHGNGVRPGRAHRLVGLGKTSSRMAIFASTSPNRLLSRLQFWITVLFLLRLHERQFPNTPQPRKIRLKSREGFRL